MALAGPPGGVSAIERALKSRPLRLRLSRRASGLLGGLALFIGVVLLADAVATVLWQDPLTAIFTQQDQKALGRKLAANEQAALPPSTLALVKRAGSAGERMAVLSRHLQGRTAAGQPLGRIEISRAHVNFVFVAGTGETSLKE